MTEEITTDKSSADATIQLVVRFNDALNDHNVDRMMQLMTEDCVFENTDPAPDGRRYEGQPAVRAFWEDFMRTSREPRIEIEEIVALGERCMMRWTYSWLDAQGSPGHIRGVDVYKVRRGLIAEKLSYVKG
ncbi:MAG: nuclear transport factor 2 family protein [Chloroflexota bacterium]